MQNIKLHIATEFSETPGGRLKKDGPFSGEEFLILLRCRFQEALQNKVKLQIYLDGVAGYGIGFLDTAFGGLTEEFGFQTVLRNVSYVSYESDMNSVIFDIFEIITERIPEDR